MSPSQLRIDQPFAAGDLKSGLFLRANAHRSLTVAAPMGNMRLPRLVPLALAVMSAVSGCGPGRLLDAPAELPMELEGRRLWHTPQGYIFASSEAVAGETDRWMRELSGHIRRTYHRPLGKGLVFVIEKDEPSFVRSFEEMVRLQRRTARAAGVEQHEMPNDGAQRQKLEAAGMSESLACRVTPYELDHDALVAGKLPGALPPDVEWSISCPSQALMEAALWEFGPKAIEQKKGKAFAIATAWAWPLAFAESAKGFQLGRDVLAFELWTIRQSDWSADQRRDEISRYTEERALVISPTLALALKIAKGREPSPDDGAAPPHAESAAASQPATVPSE